LHKRIDALFGLRARLEYSVYRSVLSCHSDLLPLLWGKWSAYVSRNTAGRRNGHLPANSVRMIRKLKSGEYRLYSRKINPKTGKPRNLGTFSTREEAAKHERAVQFFKRAH